MRKISGMNNTRQAFINGLVLQKMLLGAYLASLTSTYILHVFTGYNLNRCKDAVLHRLLQDQKFI